MVIRPTDLIEPYRVFLVSGDALLPVAGRIVRAARTVDDRNGGRAAMAKQPGPVENCL